MKLEVPDSSLLLLDRVNLRKTTTISYMGRARPKQTQITVAPTTAATPVTNSSSSSSTSESSRPCTCTLGVCKCCTGLIMDLFKQKACMRVTYHPGDFAFDVAMSWNDRILYENSLTGNSHIIYQFNLYSLLYNNETNECNFESVKIMDNLQKHFENST